jgi:hypothetical protein
VTLRPVAPDSEVIAWLWSEEGLLWHQKSIKQVRHAYGSFAEIKNDHECTSSCQPHDTSPFTDGAILKDISEYGLWGVPPEWKQR